MYNHTAKPIISVEQNNTSYHTNGNAILTLDSIRTIFV